ncbi:MAG: Peptidase M23B [Pseudolabrys sp.]|nr:Peptidase M23B [Pseudolabrys sp.]
MDQGKSRAAGASRHAESELGNEPPLSVDGGTAGFVDRRRISVQWFVGTILTALSGAALMGGAVFTSLDGQMTFASLPEHVELALRGALGAATDKFGLGRKGDRLPQAMEPNVSRQMFRVSMTAKVGNHEVVRVLPYVRVVGNLSMTVSDLSVNIPPFNPQRMMTADSDAAPAAPPQAEPDAEVAFVMRDLPPLLDKVKIATVTSNEEVLARVREAADWMEKSARHLPVAANITGVKLAYAQEGNANDPYAGFEARIVPENVTLLAKTTSETTGGNTWDERIVNAKKGDTVASLLTGLGADDSTLQEIGAVLNPRTPLKDGQKLRVLMGATPGHAQPQPIRVIVADDTSVDAVVALSDTGKYVSVDVKSVDTDVADSESGDASRDDGSGVRLYQSIYETARRDQIPDPIIDDLIHIYSYDVDFHRKVQPGDSFEVLYAGNDENGGASPHNEVMFTSLTVGGETKRFYRYQTPDDGIVDYYDENGKSAKKFLLRKPVVNGIMRSGFGLRRHPLLGYTKMHTGVDWAAPTGTPIYAAGNGTVEKAGWESGYGKFVLIKHNNGYETAYGHMTAFARGIDDGTKVRQGQVIGFVGSTGLSTGSHVHFEIRINGRFVDPMRIKLPRGRELQGPVLASFERERSRIDRLMTRAPTRTAQR